MKLKNLKIGDYVVFQYQPLETITGRITEKFTSSFGFEYFQIDFYNFYDMTNVKNINIIDEIECSLRR